MHRFPPTPPTRQSLDPEIYPDLLKRIVEVETKAFIREVLYKDLKTMQQDELLAAEYLQLSQTPSSHEGRAGGDPTDSSLQQPTIPPPTTSHLTESTPNGRPSTPGVPPHQKPLLQESYPRETNRYAEHVKFLDSISLFFRVNKKDVDEAWLPAQSPGHDASQDAGPPLNRVFQNTHNMSQSHLRYNYGHAGLVCLLIKSGGAGEPKESKPKPKVTAHWKDVLVPIELRKTQDMDESVLVQMAQYARSIMVEQYDRTFVITVLITGSMCRVFHWDVAGAQVTRPFSIHENTQLFSQVIGRLATMTPSELGYDTNFSNAGRVRSTEKIETHLTIHLSKPRPFPDHAIPSPTPECPHKLVVKLEEMLFESTDGLFNRAMRVWKAVPVNDPPPQEPDLWSKKDTYIVKQNWADDKRPNEGIFHTLAEDVAAVPKLVGMEERELTRSFRTRFEEQEILGVPLEVAVRMHGGDGSGASDSASTGVDEEDVGDEEGLSDEGDLHDWEEVGDEEVRAEDVVGQKIASEADTGNKEPLERVLERVLVRFVFKGQGRPLSEATDSIELLQATAQWVTGLVELDGLGITHGDVSYGNLLLPLLKDDEKGQASIIDLGLANLKTKKLVRLDPAEYRNEDIAPFLVDCRPHHHVTGTLRFVAIELLQKAEKKQQATHALHHDLESVFWVLLYTCIKHHEGDHINLGPFLRGLTSSDPHVVLLEKKVFFVDGLPLQTMGGDFYELEGFLREFGNLCRRKGNVVQAAEILTLISNEIQEILKQREMREMQRVAKRKLKNRPKHGPAPATAND